MHVTFNLEDFLGGMRDCSPMQDRADYEWVSVNSYLATQ